MLAEKSAWARKCFEGEVNRKPHFRDAHGPNKQDVIEGYFCHYLNVPLCCSVREAAVTLRFARFSFVNDLLGHIIQHVFSGCFSSQVPFDLLLDQLCAWVMVSLQYHAPPRKG